MREKWKDVAGFIGAYRVSDKGRIMSIARAREGPHGSTASVKARVLRGNKTKSGHVSVNLHANGKTRRVFVHVLVLEAFVGPCPPGMECRHFPDRNPANNSVRNLRWGTRQENCLDAVRDGTRVVKRGEKCVTSKLKTSVVVRIRQLWSTGKYTQVELARMFDLHSSWICRLVNRKAWNHV